MRKEIDLALLMAASVALLAVVVAAPSLTPARVAIGLPFALFFPGYAVLAALFPAKDDLPTPERIVLSVGISVALVPPFAFGLNYLPWGIRMTPILVGMSAVALPAAGIGWYRRAGLPQDEAYAVTPSSLWRRWASLSTASRALAVTVALMLGVVGVAAYAAVSSPAGSEEFSEFYALWPEDGSAPATVRLGRPVTVNLGVVNHEGRAVTYRIAVDVEGRVTGRMDAVIAAGKRWERPISFIPTVDGPRRRIDFLLYREESAEPYRRLHLWVDVEGPVSAGREGLNGLPDEE